LLILNIGFSWKVALDSPGVAFRPEPQDQKWRVISCLTKGNSL
jgi:hypothetical protein